MSGRTLEEEVGYSYHLHRTCHGSNHRNWTWNRPRGTKADEEWVSLVAGVPGVRCGKAVLLSLLIRIT